MAKVPTAPNTVCQEDRVNRFYQYNPDIQRIGANARLTVNVGSQAQAYAMFNFYEVKTANSSTDLAFANQTAAEFGEWFAIWSWQPWGPIPAPENTVQEIDPMQWALGEQMRNGR